MEMNLFEPTIVVVDDSPIALKILASEIQKVTEWEVISVVDPVEALKILKKRNIPLLITDINMPKMDGVALLQEVLSLKKGIQVVVVSSGTSVVNCISCFRYGATDFLSKPFVKDDFQAVFNNILARLQRWEKLASLGFLEK